MSHLVRFKEICEMFWSVPQHRCLVLGSLTFVGGLVTFQKLYNHVKRMQRRRRWEKVGKDVVVLHSMDRGKTCPHASPFVIKLETFFRMAGIKYELETEEVMGPKDKTPWVSVNGEELTDSQLIMDALSARWKKAQSGHLSPAENAVALAIQVLVDEHLYWGLISWRYIEDEHLRFFELVDMPFYYRIFMPLMIRKLDSELWGQGLGRHSYQERRQLMRKDLQALSDYLGEKPFFMGARATEVDCSVFGILSQIVWNAPDSPYQKLLTSDFPNLMSFCIRMRETFWPDWNKCLRPPLD